MKLELNRLIPQPINALILAERATGQRIRRSLISVLLTMVLGAVLDVIAPLFLRYIVNGVESWHFTAVSMAILAYSGVRLCSRLAQAAVALLYSRCWQRLYRGLAVVAYRQVVSFPLGSARCSSTGVISHTIDNGLDGARSALDAAVLGFTPIITQLALTSVVVAGVFRFYLGIAFLGFLVVYATTFALNVRRQAANQRSALDADKVVVAITTDALLSRETIKLFRGEAYVSKKIEDALSSKEFKWTRVHQTQSISRGLLAILYVFFMGTFLLGATYEAYRHELKPGDLVLLVLYINQVMSPLEHVGLVVRDFALALTRLKDFLALLEQKIEDRLIGQDLSGNAALRLEFRNVAFCYESGHEVLAQVSFVAPEGKITAIVGPSGSGKSTLARLMCRLHDPNAGEIFVNGISIKDFNLSSLREAMAIVPQDVSLLNLSLRENMLLARPQAEEPEILAALAAAGLEGVVQSLPDGLNTLVGERGLRLSGGERQRVAIARALLKRKRLLILDEATSALDVQAEERIRWYIAEEKANLTLLVISHRLALTKGADLILFLINGRITESGTHHQLLANAGQYAAMWATQSHRSLQGETAG